MLVEKYIIRVAKASSVPAEQAAVEATQPPIPDGSLAAQGDTIDLRLMELQKL
jgi:hypothetical protein